MAQRSNFQSPRILRLAEEMYLQGNSDASIIDRFLISPATYYRYKSQWRQPILKVGIHDFMRMPQAAYAQAAQSPDPLFYDIFFARKMALEMNVKLKFVFRRFDQLLDGLKNCEYDMALGLLAASDFRRSQADFSDQYVEKSGYDGCLLFNHANLRNIRSIEDMRGGRVAVLRGGANEDFLKKLPQPTLLIRPYDRYETCYKALRYNWVDAVFGPEPIVLSLQKKGFSFDTRILRLSFSTTTSIAVNRENQGLTERLNSCIQRLSASSFISDLSQKHLNNL